MLCYKDSLIRSNGNANFKIPAQHEGGIQFPSQ